jgi:uncharacterized protein YndB with AHSA1/START domain
MSEAATKAETSAAPANDAVVVECDLEAPPAKVWRALAEPEIRTEWLGEAEAGASQVRRAEPPERLDLAWPTGEGECLISFEINPSQDGGSHLTITHHAPPSASVVRLEPRTKPPTSVGQWRMAA